MGKETKIQWSDSTVNPIMGCGGCELFKTPVEITDAINSAALAHGLEIDSWEILEQIIHETYDSIPNPQPALRRDVTSTNIYHARELLAERLRIPHGDAVASEAIRTIKAGVTCYAAIQHLNRGASILAPDRVPNKGYAQTFEELRQFEGRMAEASRWLDLCGIDRPGAPWKDGLPRMIFVSDMGDAFTHQSDFEFLKREFTAVTSSEGKRHLWLWLTKRPGIMAKFADQIGGFPPNVCAMTTLTSCEPHILRRLEQLRRVKAPMRGLSIEPLTSRIPRENLNLEGIDWVIVGGESGTPTSVHPFELNWLIEIVDHCRERGVAVFVKQLGRRPMRDGEFLKLKDAHGGSWEEWDAPLRVREFPKAFHDYRANELVGVKSGKASPAEIKPSAKEAPTDEEREEFQRLHTTVTQHVQGFKTSGAALEAIRSRELWRGKFTSWRGYCKSVPGLSKSYASRLIQAARIASELEEALNGPLPIGNEQQPAELRYLPTAEGQVRHLAKLANPEDRLRAWSLASAESASRPPTQNQVLKAVKRICSEKGQPLPQRKARADKKSETKAAVQSLKVVISARNDWPAAAALVEKLATLIA
jgi:protein gp37